HGEGSKSLGNRGVAALGGTRCARGSSPEREGRRRNPRGNPERKRSEPVEWPRRVAERAPLARTPWLRRSSRPSSAHLSQGHSGKESNHESRSLHDRLQPIPAEGENRKVTV